ncbi:hypothetical protein ACFX13_029520 [Malus domestica]
MAQRDTTIAQYFHKVKSICREISELDPTALIGETRMKRIIIDGLRPKYRGFIAAIQGWPTQPSFVDFENLLAGQEVMAKQMGEVLLKGEEETLYTSKSKGTFKQYTGGGSKKDEDKVKSHQGREALIQGELQRIAVIVKSLMASVTTVGRWATWRKIVGPRKSMLKVILLLLVQRRIVKMVGILKHYSLWRKKN